MHWQYNQAPFFGCTSKGHWPSAFCLQCFDALHNGFFVYSWQVIPKNDQGHEGSVGHSDVATIKLDCLVRLQKGTRSTFGACPSRESTINSYLSTQAIHFLVFISKPLFIITIYISLFCALTLFRTLLVLEFLKWARICSLLVNSEIFFLAKE